MTHFKTNTQQSFTEAKNRDIPNDHVKNNEQTELV